MYQIADLNPEALGLSALMSGEVPLIFPPPLMAVVSAMSVQTRGVQSRAMSPLERRAPVVQTGIVLSLITNACPVLAMFPRFVSTRRASHGHCWG